MEIPDIQREAADRIISGEYDAGILVVIEGTNVNIDYLKGGKITSIGLLEIAKKILLADINMKP